MKVGVVGCGTAGNAAAILLARRGHRVQVWERVPEPGAVGAGIMLQPTGQAVLHELGLHERLRRRAAPIDRLRCQTLGGRRLFDLAYAAVNVQWQGWGLHRGALFEALFDATTHEPDVEVRCGVEVDDARPSDDAVELRSAGVPLGQYDLLVVADGAGSKLRRALDPSARVSTYPWGALWFVAEDHDDVYRHELFQVVAGTRRMLGLLPTGLGPRSAGDTSHVSLFWSIRTDRVAELRATGFDGWKREVVAADPRAAFVIDRIGSSAELLAATYHDVRCRPVPHPRVVVLGDAGHAMSPQLGQGANLALLDASVLAACIGAADRPHEGLRRFAAERRRHVGYYQWATRMLTPYFQSDRRIRGLLRDLAMPTLSAIPWVRRRMIAAMAGVARGVIATPLALPAPPVASRALAADRRE